MSRCMVNHGKVLSVVNLYEYMGSGMDNALTVGSSV